MSVKIIQIVAWKKEMCLGVIPSHLVLLSAKGCSESLLTMDSGITFFQIKCRCCTEELQSIFRDSIVFKTLT